MRVSSTPRLVSALAMATLAGGCITNDIPDEEQSGPPQCDSPGYVAFDPAHHAAQDTRLAAVAQMKQLFEAAIANPTEASAKFSAARDLYSSSAELQVKVQGRTDDHLEARPNVGADLDARIVAAFAAGAAATTAHEVEVQAEILDKAFVEFFFLSIYHELVAGSAETWDEGYGYYGAGPDNDVNSLLGFASVAKRRDENNGTALEALIFQEIVAGSCHLAEHLAAEQVETVNVFADEELAETVETIDAAMVDVLAYSVGHEALEIAGLQATNDPATAFVKLVELDGFFRPLERLMANGGGESAARASSIRASVDAALSAADASWLAAFDADLIVAAMETERAIDVKE